MDLLFILGMLIGVIIYKLIMWSTKAFVYTLPQQFVNEMVENALKIPEKDRIKPK